MLIASIRPAEKHTATVTGTEIPELRAQWWKKPQQAGRWSLRTSR